jgi:transcriptional regulator with XRE-family HTH domain
MNMTRAELAEKSDVKECVIVAYEFGRRAVKLDNMVKLAKALKCKVDDIIEK